MAKKAKKVGLFDLIMMIASLIGIVMAIIGISLPFYGTFYLFDQQLVTWSAVSSTVSIVLVQTFAIISVVLTVLYSLLKWVRFGGLAEFIFAIISIICAILVAVFSAVLGANLNEIFGISIFEEIIGSNFKTSVAPYLIMTGGLLSSLAWIFSYLFSPKMKREGILEKILWKDAENKVRQIQYEQSAEQKLQEMLSKIVSAQIIGRYTVTDQRDRLKKGIFGAFLAGTAGSIIGAMSANGHMVTTFLVSYSDGSKETWDVPEGTPLYQQLLQYC